MSLQRPLIAERNASMAEPTIFMQLCIKVLWGGGGAAAPAYWLPSNQTAPCSGHEEMQSSHLPLVNTAQIKTANLYEWHGLG